MKRFNLQYFLVFVVLSLLTFFLDRQGVLDPIRPAAQFVLAPLESTVYKTKNGIVDSFSFLTFWKSGEARVKNLEQRNLELIASSNNLKQLERENAELKKQLGVNFLAKYQRVPASVLGVGRYMTLNRGRKDGVAIGQSVVYMDNFIGQVVRADSHVSFVQLPTDVESKISVKIGSEGEVKGVLNGQFNSAMILDQVTQEEDIRIAELILSSGDEGSLVPDLIVGRVKKIVSKQTDLFRRAEIEPIVKYDHLGTVFILVP